MLWSIDRVLLSFIATLHLISRSSIPLVYDARILFSLPSICLHDNCPPSHLEDFTVCPPPRAIILIWRCKIAYHFPLMPRHCGVLASSFPGFAFYFTKARNQDWRRGARGSLCVNIHRYASMQHNSRIHQSLQEWQPRARTWKHPLRASEPPEEAEPSARGETGRHVACRTEGSGGWKANLHREEFIP